MALQQPDNRSAPYVPPVLCSFLTPVPLTFLEGDLSISFPLVRPETVPVSRLFWLSVVIPCGALLFGHGLQALRTRSTLKVLVVSFAWAALGLLQVRCW